MLLWNPVIELDEGRQRAEKNRSNALEPKGRKKRKEEKESPFCGNLSDQVR